MVEERSAGEPGYGALAKGFHWLIVALLIAQYAVAWTMPDIHRGTQPDTLINLHMSLGITVLALAVLRLIWRLLHPVPLIADNLPLWQRRTAQANHALLYGLIFAMPLLGWVAASGRGWTIDVWGTSVPRLIAPAPRLAGTIGDYHTDLSYLLLALVGLHVLAALYHHFWQRDRTLTRMLPGAR